MAIHDVTSPDFKGDIQKAIDRSQQEGGGTVYLPHGTYELAETLRVECPLTLLGDGPWNSSTLLGPVGKEVLIIGSDGELRGVVLHNFGIVARDRDKAAVVIRHCWGASLTNFAISNPGIGLYVRESGPLDVMSLYVDQARLAGLFIEDSESDLFFSKVHVSNGIPAGPPDLVDWRKPANWPNPEATGLWLNRVSGAHFTDCDFIGGRVGMVVDAAGAGGISRWLKFVSVSADTVLGDAWRILKTEGLHMTGCWSGSFLNGAGLYVGPEVSQVSVVNHQWQSGRLGVANDSEGLVITGGLMGALGQPLSSSRPDWPIVRSVLLTEGGSSGLFEVN